MADSGVDRGGLNFPITVDTSESVAAVAALRAEIGTLSASLEGLRSGIAGASLGGTLATSLSGAQAALTQTGIAVDGNVVQIGRLSQTFRQVGTDTEEASRQTNLLGNNFLALTARTIALSAAHRVVFTAISDTTRAVRELASEAIAFNAEQERTVLSIAAMAVEVGNVRDAQGQLVEGARAFSVAQGVASQVVQQLRQDAIGAGLEFTKLARTFEGALGPGLRAGFNPDQVRQFAVGITEAANTIGISAERLQRQAISILSGQSSTGGGSQTLLRVIGITPDAIKTARDAGDLFDFLQTKLNAFNIAQQGSLGNFDQVLTKLQGSIQLLLGTGGAAFFDQAKAFLTDITTKIVQTGPDGLLKINPDALRIVQGIDAGFVEIARVGREIVASLDLKAAATAAEAIGSAIGSVARIIAGIAEGLAAAFGDVLTIARGIADALGIPLFGGAPAVKDIASSVELIAISMAAIRAAVLTISATTAILSSPLLLIVGSLVAGAALLKIWTDSILGIDTHFGTLRDLLGQEIVTGISTVALKFQEIALNVQIAEKGFEALNATTHGDLAAAAVALGQIIDLQKQLATNQQQQQQTVLGGVNAALDIIKNNQNADTLFQGFTRGLDTVKTGLLEFANKEFPGIFASLKTQSGTGGKQSGDEFAKEFKAALAGGSFGGSESGPFAIIGEQFKAFLAKQADDVRVGTKALETVFTSTSRFLADSIVSAFDPKNTQTIQQRFGTFLQALAKQLLDFAIQALLAKTILQSINFIGGAFSGASTAVSVAAPVASDAGLSLGSLGTVLSAFAEGGAIDGVEGPSLPGLPASDRVPIMATRGEFMHPVAAVQTYGLQFMEMIRTRSLNPAIVRSLASVSSGVSLPAPRGGGYAGGGAVADGVATAPARAVSPPVVLPAVVASEDTMGKLLAASPNAQRRFYEQNKSWIRTSLGIR